MERFALRLWLPDVPGVLGAVATCIGVAGCNVTSLEVLECDGGVAVDELVVELPAPDVADRLTASLGEIEGVGVEELRRIAPGTEERGLQVLSAAVAILESPTPDVALKTLIDAATELFELSWAVLADVGAPSYVHRSGHEPEMEWFVAFALGASAGAGADTKGSGVVAIELLNAGLTLGVGRPWPFRHRERRELDHLARVTDRVCTALSGPFALRGAGDEPAGER